MIARLFTWSGFVAMLVTGVLGCGSNEQTSTRSKTGGRSPDTSVSGKSGTTNNATTDGDPATDDSGPLASWLFTLAEAEAINPLVLTYEAANAGDDAPVQSSSLTKTRDFIADFLGDMMVLAPHAPGRDFTVTVTDDSTPNASALNQSLVINKGIIDFASNLSLALVICHEAAHSGRNHSAKAEAQMTDYENKNKTKADDLDAALKQLVETNYNPSTQKFSHTESDYKRIKPLWDAFWGEFTEYQKRFESEADIVGGRMCANAGFSQEEVVEGFNSLFKLFKTMTVKEMEFGTYTVPENEIGEFLHSIYNEDSHPTDQEREDQINRVRQAFKDGASKDIADRWKNDFPKTSLRLTPDFSLLDHGNYRHRSPIDEAATARTQRVLVP